MVKHYLSGYIDEFTQRAVDAHQEKNKLNRLATYCSIIEGIARIRHPDKKSGERFIQILHDLSQFNHPNPKIAKKYNFFYGNTQNSKYFYTAFRCCIVHEGVAVGLMLRDHGEYPGYIADITENYDGPNWISIPIDYVGEVVDTIIDAFEFELRDKYGTNYEQEHLEYEMLQCVSCNAFLLDKMNGIRKCVWCGKFCRKK